MMMGHENMRDNDVEVDEEDKYHFMGVLAEDDSGAAEDADELDMDPDDMDHSAFEFIQSNTSMNHSHMEPIQGADESS